MSSGSLKDTGSYRFHEEAASETAELQRLRAQVDLTWQRELRLLTQLGVNDGGRIVELGCGPGFVLQRLHEAFPAAHLCGVDSDAKLLARAAEVCSAAALRHADAANTGLDSDACDLVLARYLFQHLRQPADVASEMKRLLRPGGRAVIVDIDQALWGIAEPSFPEVIPIHIKHGRAQAGRGGDQRIGRKLWRVLRDAGFGDVQLDLVAVHSDDVGLDAFAPQLHPDRLLISLRSGAITEAEMATLRSAYDRFMAHPDAFALMVVCVASGVREG